MLTTAELAAMRDTADDALPDTCTITRATGDPTFNPATGEVTPAPTTEVYTGACRVRPDRDRVVQAGEEPVTLRTFTGTLPHSADEVENDDRLTVTASTDEALVDRTFRVVDVRSGTWDIARRLVLEHDAG